MAANSHPSDAQNEPFSVTDRPLRSVQPGQQPAERYETPPDPDDPPRAESDEEIPRMPLAQRIREQEGR